MAWIDKWLWFGYPISSPYARRRSMVTTPVPWGG
jgi:hypothetical protein